MLKHWCWNMLWTVSAVAGWTEGDQNLPFDELQLEHSHVLEWLRLADTVVALI